LMEEILYKNIKLNLIVKVYSSSFGDSFLESKQLFL